MKFEGGHGVRPQFKLTRKMEKRGLSSSKLCQRSGTLAEAGRWHKINMNYEYKSSMYNSLDNSCTRFVRLVFTGQTFTINESETVPLIEKTLDSFIEW